MAKVIMNPLFSGISGKIGGIVFRRLKNGKVVACLAPDVSTVEPSPAQENQREKMRQAHAYARTALQDPGLQAYYEQTAARTKTTPHQSAVTDFLRGTDRFPEDSE